MKLFNIEPVERDMSFGKLNVIVLGERGRGRFESVLPCGVKKGDAFGQIGLTKSGAPKIIPSTVADSSWLAVVSGEGCYTRNTYGSVYCQSADIEKIKILAVGNGAYGDAGRIGDWNDFLVTIADNTFLRVRPSGGEHKIARYWLYFAIDKVHKVSDSELDVFCETFELALPSAENAVDLNSLFKKPS